MGTKEIIKSAKLPTLSKTLYEIIELEKRNPISFARDIKKIVEMDPLLSAHILKIANSPHYGFSQKVRTIAHAIGLLGVRRIRTIAFTFSIFDFFKRAKFQPQFGKTFNLVIKKTLLLSAVSTILARKIEYLNPDELYVSGLLADIGQLILCLHSPQEYQEIYHIQDNQLIPREKETFGIDHVQLGIEFCAQHNFPEFIKNGIKEHYQLDDDSGNSKIAFIANQLAELLLSNDDDERKRIFKELENRTKKMLHLSLSEVEEAINELPQVLDTFISGFPEIQKDLNEAIRTGSSMIINLMKKEMDMVLLAQELTDSQKKLAKEKVFLSHMLNLSYFFSSLMSPERIIASLFEYFENFITEFSIHFINREPGGDNFVLLTGKEDAEGTPILLEEYPSLTRARLSNEPVRLEPAEIKSLHKNNHKFTLVFPISYHNNFFGFLLLYGDKDHYLSLDLEVSYVQILANIIANSFQNYRSFRELKKETNKKELVTRELFKFDEELDQSKKLLLRLQKSEIVSEMLPVIFHKLKNKLTPILGYAQILMAKVQDENIRTRMQKIERNANELSEQLNQLRDYFSAERLPREKENINNIIKRLMPYFDEIRNADGIRVELELDFNIADAMMIPGQVESLVVNLVENAFQAIKHRTSAGKAGLIQVITRRFDDRYHLIVKDNGVGIPEEEIPLVWTPFFSNFEGHTGLGLTICEKVLHNHDAECKIESQPGVFTQFINIFRKTPETEVEETGEQKPAKQRLHGKILIVDDEPYLLDLMKEILLNGGDFEITTTTRGPEALKLIDSSFDLIISDIRMPEVSGMEIYQHLKSKRMENRVIMVTADPFSGDISHFLKQNRIDFLKKPFELMEFKKRVIDKLS